MRNLVSFRHFDANPFSLFNEFERDMSSFFDSLTLGRTELPLGARHEDSLTPHCDIIEKDTYYLLSFDLPGIPREDIQIEVQDSQVRLSGERKYEASKGGYSEKKYGCFERVMTLPEGIDEEKIEAHHENGVLTIALPKVEKALPKKIAINNSRKEGIWSWLLKTDKRTDDSKTVELKSENDSSK